MALRAWADVPYLPILGMRPAEMRALEELPGQTKDALLPIIPLRPWVGSHRLQSTLDRIEQSYGDRPVVVSMGEREPSKPRPVFTELERLRESDDGFANWCDFVEEQPNYIPAMLLGLDPAEEAAQAAQLYSLGRGLVVHIERPAFGNMEAISALVGAQSESGNGVCFVIDFGVASRDHLSIAALSVGYINTILEYSPNATVSISASSFPSSFSNLESQEIYERLLYDEIQPNFAGGQLIYSDRGSARAEQLSGGSGVIPARIDYPLFNAWNFYRSEDTGFDGYVEQAGEVMASDVWNGDLRVWGTQMIERTARGDHSAIDTPAKSTAARINLHLQLQTFYGDIDTAEDTEEDWDDS